MEYSMSSDKGIITTSSLSSSSSSPSASPPSSSSSPSTNYPPSPPPPSSSAEPSSSSSSSPNSPPTDPPPAVSPLPSSSHSAVLPPTATPVTVVMISSCDACKFLERICTENCVLATCFPADDPIKFTTVHRVFGASNVIKFLQELPESRRADAVSSMVYEANARLKDPVYGCAGAICQLQKQVDDLQAQSAKAQAEVVNMQCQLQKKVIIHQAQLANAQALQCHLQKEVSDQQSTIGKRTSSGCQHAVPTTKARQGSPSTIGKGTSYCQHALPTS